MIIPIYAFILIELLVVGRQDLKYKKIFNYWPLLNLVFFALFLFVFPKIYSVSWETFFIPLVFLAVGFTLFALKIMGAGDTKYLVTMFLLIPASFHEKAVLYLIITTCLVGAILFIINVYKNRNLIKQAWMIKDLKMVKSIFGKKFSFAPVIFLSWICFGVDVFFWSSK